MQGRMSNINLNQV